MATFVSTIRHRRQHLAVPINTGMAMLVLTIQHHIQTLNSHALVLEELGIARAIIAICPVQHLVAPTNIGMATFAYLLLL